MADDVVGVTTFCDDIRQERGNKYSLMGCYGHELILDEIPAILPRVCAHVVVSMPISALPENLTIRARIKDDVIGEVGVPPGDLAAILEKLEKQGLNDASRINLQVVMGFSPLVVPGDIMLRILVETELGESGAGRLAIRKRNESDPAF
ncbi:MAG: hypothetical protein JNJ44_04860 [Zoogloeaceae bacterium]|nr:hypothetical protein [Zoogloeaceae bacterium]